MARRRNNMSSPSWCWVLLALARPISASLRRAWQDANHYETEFLHDMQKQQKEQGFECVMGFHANNEDCYYNGSPRRILPKDFPREALIGDGNCRFDPNFLYYRADCEYHGGDEPYFFLESVFCVNRDCTLCADPHDGAAISVVKPTADSGETSSQPPVYISHYGSIYGICPVSAIYDPYTNKQEFFLEYSGNCISAETCRPFAETNGEQPAQKRRWIKNPNDHIVLLDEDDGYDDAVFEEPNIETATE